MNITNLSLVRRMDLRNRHTEVSSIGFFGSFSLACIRLIK